MSQSTAEPLTATVGEAALPVTAFDETRAVEPLDHTPGWDVGEPPETYPTGL